MLFDPVVSKSWDKFLFVGEGFHKIIPLNGFRYKMIRGIDFYQYTQRALGACENVTFCRAKVDQIQDDVDGATVTADGRSFHGRWVFDSTFSPGDFKPDPRRYHNLMQHFLGWEIETPNDAFDPQVMTLFDFRTPQKDTMRFMYVLPYSRNEALVEYTLFSALLLTQQEYEEALKDTSKMCWSSESTPSTRWKPASSR